MGCLVSKNEKTENNITASQALQISMKCNQNKYVKDIEKLITKAASRGLMYISINKDHIPEEYFDRIKTYMLNNGYHVQEIKTLRYDGRENSFNTEIHISWKNATNSFSI